VSWTCDGTPKNGQQYPNCSGPHPPYENHGPDCAICGLPQEAMQSVKTVVSGGGAKFPLPIPAVVAIALLLLLGGGGWWYFSQRGDRPVVVDNGSGGVTTSQVNPLAIVSQTAVNSQLMSQGEQILITGGKNYQEKIAAASAFAAQDWPGAIQQYQQAVNRDRNDPEAKIYLNNAKAKQAGTPLTMAVVVPITARVNEAKEVLRGVAQYQEEFNQVPSIPGRLLEVVVVNEKESALAESLSKDIIQSSAHVLGVIGHGVDNNSRQALSHYEQNNVAVLSPLNTAITTSNGQSTVKTIPLSQTTTLLTTYLQRVGETLVNYAVKNHSPAKVTIFYNSDNRYSQDLKTELLAALSNSGGTLVEEVDILSPGFDATTAMNTARQGGSNIAFLALSKNQVDTAIALAKANQNRLVLLSSDEMYNPTILVQGGDAIKGMVLAVPWRWRNNDPFANQAAQIWQGRVSWRTATTYDATHALANTFTQYPGDRAAITQQLNQGVSLTKTATEFNIFNEIPLVKANPGTAGPTGSKYQFDPI
jgi:branched-chain amino acid transport system substrate-binding protein